MAQVAALGAAPGNFSRPPASACSGADKLFARQLSLAQVPGQRNLRPFLPLESVPQQGLDAKRILAANFCYIIFIFQWVCSVERRQNQEPLKALEQSEFLQI
jgi:hypothetical protein